MNFSPMHKSVRRKKTYSNDGYHVRKGGNNNEDE